jgi:hypothetical protein
MRATKVQSRMNFKQMLKMKKMSKESKEIEAKKTEKYQTIKKSMFLTKCKVQKPESSSSNSNSEAGSSPVSRQKSKCTIYSEQIKYRRQAPEVKQLI